MKSLYYYNTSIGKIGIAEEKGLITNICYITSKIPANIKIKETETTKEAYKQISEYLNKNDVYSLWRNYNIQRFRFAF